MSIDLLLLQDGQSPSQLATATSNASGGLDPVHVTIPKSTVTGTYVVFAQCNNASTRSANKTNRVSPTHFGPKRTGVQELRDNCARLERLGASVFVLFTNQLFRNFKFLYRNKTSKNFTTDKS